MLKKKRVIELNEEILAYASRFVSFLIERLGKDLQAIDRVILYGSVARGTADEESDVDIFIDTENQKKIEDEVKKVLEEFYESKEYALFRSKGIKNEINLVVGRLKEWKELHKSIVSTGKVLWGDFRAEEAPIGTRHKILAYWDDVGKNRSAFLNKLYGFETKDKRVKGLLEKWKGKKTGKSSILVPFKYKSKLLEILDKYKVNAKTIEVFTVSE